MLLQVDRKLAADTNHELPLGTEALPDARKTFRIWTQKQQGTSVSCEVHAGDNWVLALEGDFTEMEWLHSALEGCPASKRQRHQSHPSSSICPLQTKQHQVLRCVDSIPCSFQKAIQGAALAVCREVDPDDLREAIDRLFWRIKLQLVDETVSYLVD